jgi:hypothetical protein
MMPAAPAPKREHETVDRPEKRSRKRGSKKSSKKSAKKRR